MFLACTGFIRGGKKHIPPQTDFWLMHVVTQFTGSLDKIRKTNTGKNSPLLVIKETYIKTKYLFLLIRGTDVKTQ